MMHGARPMTQVGHAVQYETYVSTPAGVILPEPQNSNRANTQIGILYTQNAPRYIKDDYSALEVKTTAVGEEMTTPTNSEIDLKLALAEARTETRFVELSGNMKRMID
jgi:hypothetical protein